MKYSTDQKFDAILGGGGTVDYSNPEATNININDIRIHLQGIHRFNGGIPVTLLSHLALCRELALNTTRGEEYLLSDGSTKASRTIQAGYCAIHDFSEVYVGDMVTRLKNYFPDFVNMETRFDNHIHNHFGLPLRDKNAAFVKAIDITSLCIEATIYKHPAAEFLTHERYKVALTDEDLKLGISTVIQKPDNQWIDVMSAIANAHSELNKETN